MNDDEQEPPRPEPDFRIYVERGTERTDVTHEVIDAYDRATGCLDFGSGFLSTEELQHLIDLGKAIGAEPLDSNADIRRIYRKHAVKW